MCFVCAVSRVRMAPRRRREEYAGSTRSAFMPRQGRGGFLWEATLYQEKFARQDSGFCRKRYRAMARGFFWEATRRRREEYAGRARPPACAACGGQSPLLCRAAGA